MSTLLMLAGVLSLVWLIPGLVVWQVRVPIEALGIPIGFGLLRLSKGWRTVGLILLGLAFVIVSAVFALALMFLVSSKLRVSGLPVASAPAGYQVAAFALLALVLVWMMRVLLDPRLRVLCRVLGPRMKWIKPGVLARYRRAMVILSGGSIAVGILLAGVMLVYAEDFDRWLLRRAKPVRSLRAFHNVEKSGVSPTQIKITLSWVDGTMGSSGPHFSPFHNRGPLTGRIEASGLVQSSFPLERIDSKDYRHVMISGRDKTLEDVEDRALDMLYYVETVAKEADIRLTCRVATEIAFEEDLKTAVTDVKTNRTLIAPYLLQPGEYRLRATATALAH